jgi:hypothetical protein
MNGDGEAALGLRREEAALGLRREEALDACARSHSSHSPTSLGFPFLFQPTPLLALVDSRPLIEVSCLAEGQHRRHSPSLPVRRSFGPRAHNCRPTSWSLFPTAPSPPHTFGHWWHDVDCVRSSRSHAGSLFQLFAASLVHSTLKNRVLIRSALLMWFPQAIRS